MWTYLTIAFFASVVSFILTPVAIRLRPRLSAMDMPNPLSIHSRPTPRTGGLAIFAGFLIAICLAAVITRAHTPVLLGVLAAAVFLAILSLNRGEPLGVVLSLALLGAGLMEPPERAAQWR